MHKVAEWVNMVCAWAFLAIGVAMLVNAEWRIDTIEALSPLVIVGVGLGGLGLAIALKKVGQGSGAGDISRGNRADMNRVSELWLNLALDLEHPHLAQSDAHPDYRLAAAALRLASEQLRCILYHTCDYAAYGECGKSDIARAVNAELAEIILDRADIPRISPERKATPLMGDLRDCVKRWRLISVYMGSPDRRGLDPNSIQGGKDAAVSLALSHIADELDAALRLGDSQRAGFSKFDSLPRLAGRLRTPFQDRRCDMPDIDDSEAR